MRLIATLPEEPARRFADYLTTIQIASQLLPESGGLGVWVCDEDRVGRAREELQQFLREPAATRYARASADARALARREQAEEEEYRRLQQEAAEQLEADDEEETEVQSGPRPLTLGVIAVCLLMAIATNMGSPNLSRDLLISTAAPNGGVGLHEVLSGQLWRLVTPIFLHFKIEGDPTGLMHLGFNLLLFYPLASQIESARGTGRFLGLLLLLALASNLTQYYLGGTIIDVSPPQLVLRGWWNFGGLSGVVYGLFGYMWMKGRFQPELGLSVAPSMVVLLLAWLIVGPMMDRNIANAAHCGGLIAGGLIGVLPSLWQRAPDEDGEEAEED